MQGYIYDSAASLDTRSTMGMQMHYDDPGKSKQPCLSFDTEVSLQDESRLYGPGYRRSWLWVGLWSVGLLSCPSVSPKMRLARAWLSIWGILISSSLMQPPVNGIVVQHAICSGSVSWLSARLLSQWSFLHANKVSTDTHSSILGMHPYRIEQILSVRIWPVLLLVLSLAISDGMIMNLFPERTVQSIMIWLVRPCWLLFLCSVLYQICRFVFERIAQTIISTSIYVCVTYLVFCPANCFDHPGIFFHGYTLLRACVCFLSGIIPILRHARTYQLVFYLNQTS